MKLYKFRIVPLENYRQCRWTEELPGKRNCPKHVEFHFQNKFEKLVHLVGFIVKKSQEGLCSME
jgi:hypothetical protein